MQQQSEIVNRLREWSQRHTQGALTQHQPEFWLIFWLTAALSAGLYYFTCATIASHLGQDGQLILQAGYLSLPLLVPRNLHAQALILVGTSLLTLFW